MNPEIFIKTFKLFDLVTRRWKKIWKMTFFLKNFSWENRKIARKISREYITYFYVLKLCEIWKFSRYGTLNLSGKNNIEFRKKWKMFKYLFGKWVGKLYESFWSWEIPSFAIFLFDIFGFLKTSRVLFENSRGNIEPPTLTRRMTPDW